MSDIALRVEGLGKRYRLGIKDGATGGMYRYKSLRDSFGSLARQPLQTLRSAVVRQPMDETNSFWALSDVNFEVKRGEVVGIIGRNGAGKSTLLKILSRITKPTTGHVALYGRVGSLLEVGTGFHPELSGRENIYLNGAILGMTRAEVKGKFDEIVAFSEVERFLDTPVKQYSSGMYMRLAFAVAAHLEPEILVVDEVLAVGDAEFQKKCLGKMKDVAAEGRTVLFVSHNLNQVERLCDVGILMSRGRLLGRGPIASQISAYSRSMSTQASPSGGRTILPDLEVCRCELAPPVIRVGDGCEIIMEMRATQDTRVDDLCLLVCDEVDTRVGALDFRGCGIPLHLRAGEVVAIRTRLAAIPLVEREYRVGLFSRTQRGFSNTLNIASFEVVAGADHRQVGLQYTAKDRGYLSFDHESIVATASPAA